jgi:hypothetical protein
VDVQEKKDDDRPLPPVVVPPPPVVMPSTLLAYPMTPERWMPRVGEYEFLKRIDQDRNDSLSQHIPLRFDSALFPVLNLNSVKDLGLTEPVENDASQRISTFDGTQAVTKTAFDTQPQHDIQVQDKIPGDRKLALDHKISKEIKQIERKMALPGRQGLTEKLKHAGNNKLASLSRLS